MWLWPLPLFLAVVVGIPAGTWVGALIGFLLGSGALAFGAFLAKRQSTLR